MSTITDDIRESYADILSEEQIEATIKWWSEKEKQAFEQGRQAGIKEAIKACRDRAERGREGVKAGAQSCAQAIEALLKEVGK